jgi:hypothetical protein
MRGASQSDLQSPCVRLLESKKSQNLAISLKALNVKIEDVITAVNEGDYVSILVPMHANTRGFVGFIFCGDFMCIHAEYVPTSLHKMSGSYLSWGEG